VQVLFSGKASASPDDILYQKAMVYAAGMWNVQVSSNTPGIGALWQAGRAPGRVYVYFNVTDTYGNVYFTDEMSLMPFFVLHVVDTIAPIVDISSIENLAQQTLDPDLSYELHVWVPVAQGESFIRRVVMYMSPTRPTGNSLADWQGTNGVEKLRFVLISAPTREWMAELPPQALGGKFYWAFYVQDYAGNDNAGNLIPSNMTLVYAPIVEETMVELPVGYAFIGVVAFGLVFAISYRIQQSRRSFKLAKKVTLVVKKTTPGKKAGDSSSSKKPISKDIPTKTCPVCNAKISIDLRKCPYCHREY